MLNPDAPGLPVTADLNRNDLRGASPAPPASKFYCLLFVLSVLTFFIQSAVANTSATNSGLLISAPQTSSDSITITATNTSDKSISFSARIYYTYESLSGNRVDAIKTVSETIGAGQSDASAGTLTERRIQVNKVTIFSVSSF
jgi:hypothetical protein